MEQSCSSLLFWLLSWVEQVAPAQLLCCASGLSTCFLSDTFLASQVQWLSSSWTCGFVFERKLCCVWTGSDRTTLALQMAQWTRRTRRQDWTKIDETMQKWWPWVRTLTSGDARSDEWSWRMKSSAEGWACWRSLSTIVESGEATGKEFDFSLCCWAARVRPRWTFVVIEDWMLGIPEGFIVCVLSKDYFCLQIVLFCCLFSLFFTCASASCSWHLVSIFSFFPPRGRGVFVGGGVCNGCGLGPGLETGSRLEKRGSPRGLV